MRTLGYLSIFFLAGLLVSYLISPELFAQDKNTKVLHVAILPICNEDSCNPDLPTKLEKSFFNYQRGVAAFIEEISAGRVKVEGKVSGWLKPDFALKNASDVIRHKSDLINLASTSVNISDYDVFYIYTKTSGSGTQMGLAKQRIELKNGLFMEPGIAYMVNSDINFSQNDEIPSSVISPSNSWAHELLHILGLQGHANSLRCLNTDSLSSCEFRAYGDAFSTMGEAVFSLSPNWSMKRTLSWAESSDIQKVSSNGSYTIDTKKASAPRALEISLPKAITLKPGVTFDRLFIEKRSNKGFDDILNRLSSKSFLNRYREDNTNINSDGALLYFAYQGDKTPTTVLIDSHPQSHGVKALGIKWPYNPGEMSDAMLNLHESLNIFDSGLSVELTDISLNGLTVKLSGY